MGAANLRSALGVVDLDGATPPDVVAHFRDGDVDVDDCDCDCNCDCDCDCDCDWVGG